MPSEVMARVILTGGTALSETASHLSFYRRPQIDLSEIGSFMPTHRFGRQAFRVVHGQTGSRHKTLVRCS